MHTFPRKLISLIIFFLVLSTLQAKELSFSSLPTNEQEGKTKLKRKISLRSFFDYSTDIGKYHHDKHRPESTIYLSPTFHIYKHVDIKLEMETIREHYRDEKLRKQKAELDDLNVELALTDLSPIKNMNLKLFILQDLEGRHLDKSFGFSTSSSYKPSAFRKLKFKLAIFTARNIYDLEKDSTPGWQDYTKHELTITLGFRYKFTNNLYFRSRYKITNEWDFESNRIDYYKIYQTVGYNLPDDYTIELGLYNRGDTIRLGFSDYTRFFSRIGLYF